MHTEKIIKGLCSPTTCNCTGTNEKRHMDNLKQDIHFPCTNMTLPFDFWPWKLLEFKDAISMHHFSSKFIKKP